MRLLKRLSLCTTLLTVMAAVVGVGAADASAENVVGHVYVNDNTAGPNTIAAFDRHADGTLTPMPGSPFATGGAGTGTSTGSQGSLQITRLGHYLLAVDAGSNQISVLRIRPDGGLVNGLSSSFGGDSLDATTMNPLVSARFPAPRPAPETCALLRDVVRAYSAGHPWPTGDHLSQPPRSTTSTRNAASTATPDRTPAQ